MTAIDIAQLKKFVTALNQNDASLQLEQEDPSLPFRRAASQRAIAGFLQKFFSKLGLKSSKVDKLIRDHNAEVKDIIKKQESDAASYIASKHNILADALQARLKTLEFMTGPFTSSFVILDTPFLIWEYPHPVEDIFLGSHIERAKSWIKVTVGKYHGADDTQFKFHFLWTNDTDSWSHVNVTTSLILNGVCLASSDSGFQDGGYCKLLVVAHLNLMRWAGWPRQNGKPADGTYEPIWQTSQWQTLVDFDVAGYGLLSGGHLPSFQKSTFAMSPVDLSHRLFAIPPRGVAIFEVSLQIRYSIDDDPSLVTAYFFDGVFCPWVQLEVLAPAGTISTMSMKKPAGSKNAKAKKQRMPRISA